MTPKTALLSVYDKTGIVEFAQELVELGWDVFSSGGTANKLAKAGVPVTDIQEIVGPAILDHRVATLSRELHGGLLADYILHLEEMEQLGFRYIDLVCVDLYPLDEAISAPDATRESVIKLTDIGGPTMMLAGAKGDRVVISDPVDRPRVIEWLKAGEPNRAEFINELGAKAYFNDSCYRLLSARYHSGGRYDGMLGERVLPCKYGENAWQAPAALYSAKTADPLALDQFKVVAGTDPSYNNLCDLDRLLQTVTHIAAGWQRNFRHTPYIAVGVKHGNACCAAVSTNPVDAITHAYEGDPRAIFGGVFMTNFTITIAVAERLESLGVKLDGIAAPQVDQEAVAVLERKGGKCRILVNPYLWHLDESSLDTAPRRRYVRGGFLQQPNYTYVLDLQNDLTAVYGNLEGHETDLVLAWAIGSTSNSNTITIVKNGMLIGNGVGQQDRVSCCELAIKRARDAGHDTAKAVAYSDSFFPFPDGPETLMAAGVRSILATSGSVKDNEVEDAFLQQGLLFWQPDAQARGFFGH